MYQRYKTILVFQFMFQLYKKNWDLHTRAGVTRFSTLFCSLKDSTYCTVCPVWTGKNDIVKFFVFCEDIQSQNRVRLVVDNADTLSKLSETTPTPCLRSHWLRWNRVRVVNEYFTKCPRSQRLRLQKVCETVFACSSGAKVESVKQKRVKNLWHCPFKGVPHLDFWNKVNFFFFSMLYLKESQTACKCKKNRQKYEIDPPYYTRNSLSCINPVDTGISRRCIGIDGTLYNVHDRIYLYNIPTEP